MTIPSEPSRHFITFSNRGYSSPKRILDQAKSSGFFGTVQSFSDSDISPLIFRHMAHFLIRRRQGFGRFIWKPYIILKFLNQVSPGDLLVYSDLGNHIHSESRAEISRYFELMDNHKKDIGVFEVGQRYISSGYVRKRFVNYYFPNFYTNSDSQLLSVYGGLILIRNTPHAKKVFRDWLHLCEKFLPKVDLGWKCNERSEFVGQDSDNGFLPLVLSKHQVHVTFPGTDINIYDEYGVQAKHS